MYYQTDTRHKKALAILRLAREMQCRPNGISLAEISELFGVSRGAAEDMRNAVLSIYPDGKGVWHGAEKRWHIPGTSADSVAPLQNEDQEALSLAVSMLRQSGLEEQALRLQGLLAQVHRLVPRTVRTHIKPDFELLMISEGLPQPLGPRPRVERSMLAAAHEAILLGQQVTFAYTTRDSGSDTIRTVEPHGILYGLQPYLLAWDRHSEPEGFRLFSLSEISGLDIINQRFVRQEGFY